MRDPGHITRDVQRLRFRRQWAILKEGDRHPEGWPVLSLSGGRRLWLHPDLRIKRAAGSQGRLVLLGLAVIPSSPHADLQRELALCIEANHPDQALIGLLHRLAGTYVLLWDQPPKLTIYTDPAGMMGVYYGAGRAASTPSLLPNAEPDLALHVEFPFGGANDWYPGSLCPFLGVRALFANHRLDLDSGEISRFWPLSPVEPRSRETALPEICDLLRGTVAGLLPQGTVCCSITGGRDSRVSLAAARPHVEEIQFFTLRGPGVKACDIRYGVELARRFQLNYSIVDIPEPEPWLLSLYDELSAGMAVGSRREIVSACVELAGPDVIHLNGNLGAITKSFFWPSPRPQLVDRNALAKEFTAKPPRILAAIDEWKATLPALPPTMAYNLMYLEQRGGRWMGPGETASCLFFDSTSVFASREVFELVNAFPLAEQYGGRLLVDFVDVLWPDLLSVPYCHVTRNWGTYLPKQFKEWIKRRLHRPALP